MFRSIPRFTLSAALLLGCLGSAHAADEAQAPLAKEGDTYVSLQVECPEQCASFEIYVFDNGRMTFRPNNEHTSTHAIVNKNGVQSIYKRIAKYLQDTGAFAEQPECTGSKDNAPAATVQSAHDGQVQKARWSAGCTNQVEKARALVKVFVNQTGMWRDINHDSRYWEKYWETWEDKK